MEGCNHISQEKKGAQHHFGQIHAANAQPGTRAPMRQVTLRWFLESELSDQPAERREQAETVRPAERVPARAEMNLVLNPEQIVQRRRESQAGEDMTASRTELSAKRTQHQLNVEKGVNIPQLTKEQVRKMKAGLIDLFKETINPMLRKFQPEASDWSQWTAFEGAYEEALHLIRTYIMRSIGRNPERTYGRKKLDENLQRAREQATEEIVSAQDIRRILMKLKKILDEITETVDGEDEVRGAERRTAKLTRRLGAALHLIPGGKLQEFFGTTDHGQVYNELNTNANHRTAMTEWLDAMITTQVSQELSMMQNRAISHKIQEEYRISPGHTMKRYIDKEPSPQCPLGEVVITDHFAKSWSRGADIFREAEPGTQFHLEERCGPDDGDIMESFMLNEKNIKAVIQSRDDLSSCGPDGISNQILKAAGAEGMKFMKLLIEPCIRTKRIPESWKDARTVLLYKKGDRNDISNWRPISITNCIYRIFTCLLTRAMQAQNEEKQLFAASQKGFIKRTNGCTEHGIILNELFHDACRHRKNLIVTAIDFTNAFGSVPHDLIMSTLRQRNLPEWVQGIVSAMYTGSSSTIEVSGNRTRKIGWNRGVKQGCPLSPLLFNLCLEPLLQAIDNEEDVGAVIGPDEIEERIEFKIQAYADDVIFIARSTENMERMLRKLEEFTLWAKMEVNVKKCNTASYMEDQNRHRCSLGTPLKLNGKDIPNLTLAQSLKYLGTAVAARRTVKLEAAGTKLTEMKIRLQKVMDSPLLTVQKIHATKTFVLPMIDFIMLNGDVGVRQLKDMDKHIRGQVDKSLKVRGLPIECHHMSWGDGGFSIASLEDRRNVLLIGSFGHMGLSKDEKTKKAMEWNGMVHIR
jgi:hypothetical protein